MGVVEYVLLVGAILFVVMYLFMRMDRVYRRRAERRREAWWAARDAGVVGGGAVGGGIVGGGSIGGSVGSCGGGGGSCGGGGGCGGGGCGGGGCGGGC